MVGVIIMKMAVSDIHYAIDVHVQNANSLITLVYLYIFHHRQRESSVHILASLQLHRRIKISYHVLANYLLFTT